MLTETDQLGRRTLYSLGRSARFDRDFERDFERDFDREDGDLNKKLKLYQIFHQILH